MRNRSLTAEQFDYLVGKLAAVMGDNVESVKPASKDTQAFISGSNGVIPLTDRNGIKYREMRGQIRMINKDLYRIRLLQNHDHAKLQVRLGKVGNSGVALRAESLEALAHTLYRTLGTEESPCPNAP